MLDVLLPCFSASLKLGLPRRAGGAGLEKVVQPGLQPFPHVGAPRDPPALHLAAMGEQGVTAPTSHLPREARGYPGKSRACSSVPCWLPREAFG